MNFLIMEPFSPMFFVGLILTAVFAVCFIRKYRNKSYEQKRKAIIVMYSIVFVIFMLYKYSLSVDKEYAAMRISKGLPGFNWFEELPLNLCNMNIIIMVLAMAFESRALQGFCFFAGSFGALFPLLMPPAEFTGFSILLPRMLGYYLAHYAALIETPLLAGLDLYKPKYSDIGKVLLSVIAVSVAVTILNLIFIKTGIAPGCNYFYTVYPSGISFLEFLYKLIPVTWFYLLPTLIFIVPYMFILTYCFNIKREKKTDE